jgi:hypothetical protein
MKPATCKTVYLVEAEPSEICFLEEVLYWVAFQRLPVSWLDDDGGDVRTWAMPGYEITGVKPDDDLETIMAVYEKSAEKTDQDDTTSREVAGDEAVKLHQELQTWKGKYRRAVELPAAKVYVALRGQDRLHRAGQPLGERLHRELQRPPSR